MRPDMPPDCPIWPFGLPIFDTRPAGIAVTFPTFEENPVMLQMDFQGRKVLVRVDFNVPLDAEYRVTDDTRIRAALPTIRHILEHGGAVILMSHLGRPFKKLLPDGSLDKARFTLKHILPNLVSLLGTPVAFADDCISDQAIAMASALQPGEVLLLENTRFHSGEEKGDEELAGKLAALGDLFIHDAFGTAHRAHASTAVIARFFSKEKKAFGFLMKAELDNAAKTMEHPERPLLAIVGGAKVSDKILLIENLMDKVDALIIGGGMAYTFIRAQGGSTGNSLVEEDRIELAEQLLQKAREKGVEMLLPSDSVIADRFAADADFRNTPSAAIPEGWMGLDIGPDARIIYADAILRAKTILWNGPMGVFEMPAFAEGTRAVATAIAESTAQGSFSLVGGGDSVTAVNQMGLSDKVSFVSTGGGAMLELLEGKKLPGVTAIVG